MNFFAKKSKLLLAWAAEFPYITPCARGLSAVGSAPPCQGGGRGFEPRSPLHASTKAGLDRPFSYRRSGQVVRQGPAKPSPPVRIRAATFAFCCLSHEYQASLAPFAQLAATYGVLILGRSVTKRKRIISRARGSPNSSVSGRFSTVWRTRGGSGLPGFTYVVASENGYHNLRHNGI